MKFQERYLFDFKSDLLGKGGFASVYKAKDILLDREVAIKIFSQQSGNKYSVVEEIKKVIKFEHPSLLRYYDVVLLDQENVLGQKEQLQIGVMEYANAGDLKDFAKANPNSPLLFKLLQQVLKGLEFLHQKNIIHRDLKPQNILLVEENGEINAKLSDFGISKDMQSDAKSSTMAVGTIEYMAPEQFNPQKFGIDGKIASNVDLWSFGVMVHELLMDSTPFGSRDGNTTAEQIMSTILSTEQPKDIEKLPEPYKTVVKQCLVTNAKERIRKASELLKFFDGQAHTTPPTSTVSQTNDATKVYAKSSQSTDDATKVYAKTAEAQAETKQNKTKTKMIAGLISALLVIGMGGYLANNNYKEQQLKLAQEQQAKFAQEQQVKLEKEQQVKLEKEQQVKLEKEQQAKLEKEQQAKLEKEQQAKLAQEQQAKLAKEQASKEKTKAAKEIAEAQTKKNEDDTPEMKRYLERPEQNDAEAQFKIGQSWESDIGFHANYVTALEWYLKAAAQNHAGAQLAIGRFYQIGRGVRHDYNQAMEWYLKAAAQNDSLAQANIGNLYQHGIGVQQDDSKAREWYKKAADQGNQFAKRALQKLGG